VRSGGEGRWEVAAPGVYSSRACGVRAFSTSPIELPSASFLKKASRSCSHCESSVACAVYCSCSWRNDCSRATTVPIRSAARFFRLFAANSFQKKATYAITDFSSGRIVT